jgi:predicted unusual protein kinase regulating ubiquinone biosynthesis (AarF/ABC1/UbiB family)
MLQFIVDCLSCLVKYTFCIYSYDEFLMQLLTNLIRHNILFVKVFQALSSNKHVSANILELFRKCTNNAEFYDYDVDHDLLTEITNEYNVVFDSKKPINSGMVAIVFKGYIEDKPVAVKLLRKNIGQRLNDCHKEFVFFYKLFHRILTPFGFGDIFESLNSFVDSRDYIMTQCNFADEIGAIRQYKEEIETYSHITHVDKIVVPEVYNKPDESRFIVMEFLDGRNLFYVAEEDKEAYGKIVATLCFIQTVLFDIHHTDLHPGNLIFMDNGKVGVVDYGMFTHTSQKVKSAVFNIMKTSHTNSNDYLTHVLQLFDPVPDSSHLTPEQYDVMNGLGKQCYIHLINGTLTEVIVHSLVKQAKEICPSYAGSKIDFEMIKLIMSQTMNKSTVELLIGQPALTETLANAAKEMFA